MKITKRLFYIAALLLAVTSCGKQTELSDAIPADAGYVIHLDNQSLIDKSRYDIFQNPTVQQGINLYKGFMRDQDAVKLLDEFLKDPNSLGIDLKKDLYIYTNYKTYGVVLGVNNADKLKKALLKFLPIKEDDIRKEEGVYILSPGSIALAAWDGGKLILLADIQAASRQADAEALDIRKLAIGLLKQGSDKSINSVKSFADFAQKKKDISIFYNLEGVGNVLKNTGPSELPTEIMAPVEKMLAEYKGVSMGIYTSFEKGEIKTTGEYYYDTPEAEKRFKELVSAMSGTIKGEHLKYVNDKPLFLMSMNLNGEGMYQYLSKIGIIDLMKKEFPDGLPFTPDQIERLIENIDGDFTLSLASIKETSMKMSQIDPDIDEMFDEEITTSIPEAILFADVSDPDYVLSFVKEQLDAGKAKYEEAAPSVFLLKSGNSNFYLGVHDKTFFMTNSEEVYSSLSSPAPSNNHWDHVKGKRQFFAGDFRVVKTYLERDRNLSGLIGLVDELGEYEMMASGDDFAVDAKIELRTKDDNSLYVLCQKIDKIISDIKIPLGR